MNRWLVSITAAAAAAGAFAVESQNIVGYQENNGSGTFNLVGATFAPVGTDGATMTLGDIKVNADFVVMEDSITIFNSAGNKVFSAYYLDAATAEELELAEGWYDADKMDNDDFELVNDYAIPLGSSLAFNRANSDAAIRFAGEVIEAPQTIAGAGTFNLICNSAPVDVSLGDIKVNSNFVVMEDSITIFNSVGNKVFSAYYLDTATAKELELEEGWYDADKMDNDDFELVNDYSIPAGMGFAFNRINSTAAIIIPNPVSE